MNAEIGHGEEKFRTLQSVLAERMNDIPLSGIREIFEMSQSIPDVIRLEFGELDFDTPKHIKDAACNALREGATKYTSSFGIPELRVAIAEKMRNENKVKCDCNNVVITTGATSALSLAVLTTMNPKSEILIPNPGWANYVPIARIGGAVPIGYSLSEKDDFQLDVDTLEKLITPKTRMLLINSPSNPTGAVLKEDQLKAVGELSVKHDLIILTDEVYEKFIYDNEQHFSIASYPQFRDRVITVNSFSKTYAMTGWRLGYAVAPEEMAEAIGRLNGSTNSCAAAMTQFAALHALMASQGCVTEMVDAFARRRKIVLEGLSELPRISCPVPKGAFYAFVNISNTGYHSKELSMKFLTEGHVATVPGVAFGSQGEGYIRLAYTSSEENLKIAVSRMGKVLRS